MAPALNKEFLDILTNYRVQIHSETCMWHNNNIQLNYKTQFLQQNLNTIEKFQIKTMWIIHKP